MAAFGFDDQRDVANQDVLRPLAIIFMGVGLALTGVGVTDLIASYLEPEHEGADTSWLRLRPPIAFAMEPLL